MTTSAGPLNSVAFRLGVATVAAMVVNAAIALVTSTLDDHGIKTGLAPVAYLSLTLLGVLVGAAGWTLISRFAPSALRVVVPVVLVLSWIPDLLLLGQGTTAVNIVGLMLMHVVVAVAVAGAFRSKGHVRAQAAG